MVQVRWFKAAFALAIHARNGQHAEAARTLLTDLNGYSTRNSQAAALILKHVSDMRGNTSSSVQRLVPELIKCLRGIQAHINNEPIAILRSGNETLRYFAPSAHWLKVNT